MQESNFIYLFPGYLKMVLLARLYNVEWMADRRIIICKGFGRKQSWSNQATIPVGASRQ
jgi:hypothetical protein